MKKYRLIVLIVIFLIPILFSGCDDPREYKGPYVDLNILASNSIFGLDSIDSNYILIAEEDSYGRILFVYWGESYITLEQLFGDEGACVLGVLIAQKTEGKYVYFYPDYNFVLYKDTTHQYMPTDEEFLLYIQDASRANDIERLKHENDWGKPIDENKCVRAKVSRKNRDDESRSRLVSDKALGRVSEQITPQDGSFLVDYIYLTSDDFDRHIYYARVMEESEENLLFKDTYIIMFNKDGSFDPNAGIMEPADVLNYQDELKAFKDRNGWNIRPDSK